MPIELTDQSQPRRYNYKTLAIIAVSALLSVIGIGCVAAALSSPQFEQPEYLQCTQPDLIHPDYSQIGFHDSREFLKPKARNHSIELLSGAIQIPTVSYDDMLLNVTEEPRFEVFFELHDYLARHFPLLTKHVEKINTYGLLYTIKGVDPNLKPIVLMAHQDVVPVIPESVKDWTEGPFSGVFDGEWIYGRGAGDTKNSLIAMHEAVESLLEQNWQPARTVLLSFGFDEEIQGWRGARKIAEHIENVYGSNSIEMLIDEGFGFTEEYGAHFASPAVAEKGRVNFKVTLNTPGGHSSMPPDHTGIGMISELVTRLEDDIPLTPSLRNDMDAIKARFSCIGHHGHDVPFGLRELYTALGSSKADTDLAGRLSKDLSTRVMVETTQAIDIIHGGVKINALPEEVVLEVNYRIKPASSVHEETQRFLNKVKEVAGIFELSAGYKNTFFGADKEDILVSEPAHKQGHILVETTDVLDVAPISPFYNSTHWDLLAGTVKHSLGEVNAKDFGGLPVVVTPGLMTGNTDTAHYWNLTSNIYRFMPVNNDDMRNIHTVDESLRARSHLSSLVFYYEFLINSDMLTFL